MLGGIGLISSSSFFVPQVPELSSMASFVTPAAATPVSVPVPAPVPSSKDSAWSITDAAPYLTGAILLFVVLRDKAVQNFLRELSDFLPGGFRR
jgi:hypothetical protein